MGKKKFSSQADLKIAVIGDEVFHILFPPHSIFRIPSRAFASLV
jgi:hypothetical protein